MDFSISANGFVAAVQEVIGPGGQPVTETDGSGNWQHTNVYAGSLLLATYDAQGLHFYLSDPLGTRRVQTDPAGTAEGQDTSLPWGDGFTQTASDDPTAQHYAQLTFDPETGLDHAEARQYTPWMGRWTAPDPYNGSYDLSNPQSMNRYSYVNNNPLGFVDPSGMAGGWATGIGGSVCSNTNGDAGDSSFSGINISTPIGNINPCDPAASLVGIGISAAVNGIWGAGTVTAAQIAPFVAAAVTIACSIDDFNKSACGGMSGWTSDVFTGKNAWVGKGVGDIAAVIGATLCATGGPTSPGCVGYAIYTVASDLFSVFWSDFGPAKFTGSLLPRPAALDGLGASATGIPDKNLSLQDILGQPSFGLVPSPGMNLP
jgi:RHS repeat-associated protein